MTDDVTFDTSTTIHTEGGTSGVAERELPLLVVMHGSLLGMTYQIDDEPLVIGRSSTCGVPLDDDNASRQHVKLTRDGDRVTLRDLDSTNGTYVNAEKVVEVELKDGDLIQVGGALFKFLRSSAVESAFFGQMYALATTDFLTGIFNRQHIISKLEQEFARALRYKRPLSVILYDIDRFKQINDKLGHLEGDQLLMDSAKLVQESIRKHDIFGRLGGDEFLIICPETPAEQMITLAERLTRKLNISHFRLKERSVKYSISVGIAGLGEKTRTPADLIKLADRALYQSKGHGGNCVTLLQSSHASTPESVDP